MTIQKHKRTTLFAATFLMSVASFTACGGDEDSGGANCAAGEACGGDVVGTWQIQDSCAYGNFIDTMDTMCSETTVDASGLKMTGTMAFKADKTYTTNSVLNGTMKMKMPSSCLNDESGSLTCEQFGALFTAFSALGGGNEISIQCSGTTTCACDLKFNSAKNEEVGNYALNGKKITLTSNDEDNEPETSDYCVKGSALSMSQAASAGSTGSATIKLTKK